MLSCGLVHERSLVQAGWRIDYAIISWAMLLAVIKTRVLCSSTGESRLHGEIPCKAIAFVRLRIDVTVAADGSRSPSREAGD